MAQGLGNKVNICHVSGTRPAYWLAVHASYNCSCDLRPILTISNFQDEAQLKWVVDGSVGWVLGHDFPGEFIKGKGGGSMGMLRSVFV